MPSYEVIADFPKVCDFRFTEVDDPTNPNYLVGGVYGFDQKTLKDSNQYWQVGNPYYNLRTFQDKCTVMVHTTAVGDYPVYPDLVLSGSGVGIPLSIPSGDFVNGAQRVAGNVYTDPITGATTQLDSFQWQFTFDLAVGTSDSRTGCYVLEMRVYGDADRTIYRDYVSEPILVYDEFPNTVLIEAQNNTNRSSQGIIVSGWDDGLAPTFQQRVPAYFGDYNPKGTFIAYRKGNYLINQGKAQNLRTWSFMLGGVTSGVPDYIYEKIAEMFITDIWKVNGIYYIVDANNSDDVRKIWEASNPDANNLLWASIPITERFANQHVFRTVTPTPDLLLFEIPAFPFAVSPYVINTGSVSVTVRQVVINDSGDLDDYITYMNGTFLPASSALGTYLRDSGFLYYIPAISESPSIFGSLNLYTDYFILNFTHNTIFGSENGYSYAGAGSQQVIDWGDVTAGTYVDFDYEAQVTGISYNATHEYAIGGTSSYQSRVFHNNAIGLLLFQEDGSRYPVTRGGLLGISSSLPTGLTQIYILNCDEIASSGTLGLDVSMCLGLYYVSIRNCVNVTDFITLFDNPLPVLTVILLQDMPLTATAVDNVFIDYVANVWDGVTTGGIINTECTPAQPPTAASLTARNTLISAGFTITVDP